MFKAGRRLFRALASIMGFSPPKRVVLDTNVLIAAAWNEGSASRRIVEACLEGKKLRAVMSPALGREYELIIKRAARKSGYRKSLERLARIAEVVDCDARAMGIEVPADPEDAKPQNHCRHQRIEIAVALKVHQTKARDATGEEKQRKQ